MQGLERIMTAVGPRRALLVYAYVVCGPNSLYLLLTAAQQAGNYSLICELQYLNMLTMQDIKFC